MSAPILLNEAAFDRMPVAGSKLKRVMSKRVDEVKAQVKGLKDPDVSVVIRTKNDAATIGRLLDDLENQDFGGKLQTILVDTESTDGTVEIAQQRGATVISIKQADFTYPKALNLGFEAAKYAYVLTLVGHSRLASSQMLHGLTLWQSPKLGGIYGVTLPNKNATYTEWFGAYVLGIPKLLKPMEASKDPGMGILAANCSIVSKKAWESLGGYNEAFAAGAEDNDLAKRMMAAGWTIMREPIISVHHSHGLGPINALRQFKYWSKILKPQPFDHKKLLTYRPDLRSR